MKKLAIFIAFIFLFMGFAFSKETFFFDLKGLKQVCFVTEDNITDGTETMAYNYVYFSPEEAVKEYDKYEKRGIICYFDGVDKEELIEELKGEICKVERVENVDIYYGYTPLQKNSIYLEKKKVNMQMVVKEGCIIVGFPIILSGF